MKKGFQIIIGVSIESDQIFSEILPIELFEVNGLHDNERKVAQFMCLGDAFSSTKHHDFLPHYSCISIDKIYKSEYTGYDNRDKGFSTPHSIVFSAYTVDNPYWVWVKTANELWKEATDSVNSWLLTGKFEDTAYAIRQFLKSKDGEYRLVYSDYQQSWYRPYSDAKELGLTEAILGDSSKAIKEAGLVNIEKKWEE